MKKQKNLGNKICIFPLPEYLEIESLHRSVIREHEEEAIPELPLASF